MIIPIFLCLPQIRFFVEEVIDFSILRVFCCDSLNAFLPKSCLHLRALSSFYTSSKLVKVQPA